MTEVFEMKRLATAAKLGSEPVLWRERRRAPVLRAYGDASGQVNCQPRANLTR